MLKEEGEKIILTFFFYFKITHKRLFNQDKREKEIINKKGD